MSEFETGTVNEPSVFEPLKVYCACMCCMTEILERWKRMLKSQDLERTSVIIQKTA